MDEQYRSIYGAIYDARVGGEPLGAFPADLASPEYVGSVIREAIDTAVGESPTGLVLREDAKALIALVSQDLVLLPLSLGGRLDEAIPALRADIAMIVGGAVSTQTSSGREEEVSAHNIIDSLSRNWSELKLSEFRLWE